MSQKTKKRSISKWIIAFVILSLFSFTGVAVYVQLKTSIELSSTLIVSFYAFCTGELWMLASIKKSKIKHRFTDNPETPEDESEIDFEAYNKGVEDTLSKIKEMLQQEDDK